MSAAPEWAQYYIDAAGGSANVPIYGSSEWTALPDDDPRKPAAAVRAAEAWRRDGEPDEIRRRLKAELDDEDLRFRWRLQEAELDMRRGYEPPTRPSWAELQRIRTEFLQGAT